MFIFNFDFLLFILFQTFPAVAGALFRAKAPHRICDGSFYCLEAYR